jgi:hypothetical protein
LIERRTVLFGLLWTWVSRVFLFLIFPLVIFGYYLYLFRKQPKVLVFFLLLSPYVALPVYYTASAVFDYYNNKAVEYQLGHPEFPEADNLHKETRCWPKRLGCSLTGLKLFPLFFYKKTAHFLINKYGFQEGIYLGEYPLKGELEELLSTKQGQDGAIIKKSKSLIELKVNDEVIKIKEGPSNGNLFYYLEKIVIENPVQILILNGNGMAVRFNGNSYAILDLTNRGLVAVYE